MSSINSLKNSDFSKYKQQKRRRVSETQEIFVRIARRLNGLVDHSEPIGLKIPFIWFSGLQHNVISLGKQLLPVQELSYICDIQITFQ